MVREYLESVLGETREELEKCRVEFAEKELEKREIEAKIKKIQMKAELSEEYFSPRCESQTLRRQLSEFYERLKKLNQDICVLEKERRELERKKEKFKRMVEEVVELEKKANVSRETSKT